VSTFNWKTITVKRYKKRWREEKRKKKRKSVKSWKRKKETNKIFYFSFVILIRRFCQKQKNSAEKIVALLHEARYQSLKLN